MKRTFVYATALMIAVAGLLAVARGLFSPTEHEMGEVRRGEAIETVYATGTIEARLRRTLKAHRLGVVGKVYVKEGDEVRAGDPLLRMRDTALAARKRSIKAELARVTEKLSEQSAFRKGYEARLTQARETASELRATQGRLKRQLGTGGISRDDYESAATRALVAAETLARLEQDLRRDLADLAAALEKARAEQEAVFARELDDLLTAPIDGIVLSLPLKEGEFAAAGQILAKVGDIREMIIEAEVNEDDIASVEVGKPVHIRLAGAGVRMLKGRIYEMLPDAIRATKGYTVRARFDKAEFLAAEGAATATELAAVRAEVEKSRAELNQLQAKIGRRERLLEGIAEGRHVHAQ